MNEDQIWLLIGGGAGLAVALWAWPRIEVGAGSATYDSAGPEEPCWTEEIASDGRYSYGRSGCHSEQLKEMEARARRGEFGTPD